MHWADVVGEDLLARGPSHRIASGTSISGVIHLGNAGDVIYADGIARALEAKGAKAEVVWIADDVDPLRSVPEQMPASFSEYLGRPVSTLPDPDGCHAAFADHVIEPFLTSLRDVGIVPIEKRGSRMYPDGEYDEAIRVALGSAEQIREILVRVAKSKKAPGWLPFDPICERCGRIATTDATAFEGGKVLYTCSGGTAGRKEMVGCGNQGAVSMRHGKLTWRVEWAARWKILGITCEPFGKEHSASGGSYDTSKVIVKEVYGYEPPLPVLYEHILVGGAKMSKSKGNVIALSELLDVLPPEVVRYFYFRVDPNKHKDFDAREKLLPLVEEFERAQAIAAGRAAPSRGEDLEAITRALALSQVRQGQPVDYGEVPFGHLVLVAELTASDTEAASVLARSGFAAPANVESREGLALRLRLARRFLERYVPPSERNTVFESLAAVPLADISDGGKRALLSLSKALEQAEWRPEALHNAIFEAAKASGVDPKEAFRALYLSLIGKPKGPRAGYFLASLSRPFVIRRFAEAGAAK
jgi:lysyl-tRNA synthetase, class I